MSAAVSFKCLFLTGVCPCLPHIPLFLWNLWMFCVISFFLSTFPPGDWIFTCFVVALHLMYKSCVSELSGCSAVCTLAASFWRHSGRFVISLIQHNTKSLIVWHLILGYILLVPICHENKQKILAVTSVGGAARTVSIWTDHKNL